MPFSKKSCEKALFVLSGQVVMLQCKGENHGLAKPANRKDYTVRVREIFDRCLRERAAPSRLRECVPTRSWRSTSPNG